MWRYVFKCVSSYEIKAFLLFKYPLECLELDFFMPHPTNELGIYIFFPLKFHNSNMSVFSQCINW